MFGGGLGLRVLHTHTPDTDAERFSPFIRRQFSFMPSIAECSRPFWAMPFNASLHGRILFHGMGDKA